MELAMCWSTGKLELAHLWWASSSLELFVVLSVCRCISYGASLASRQREGLSCACPSLVTLVGLVSQHCSQEQGEDVALRFAPVIQLGTATSFHQTKTKLVKGDGDGALKC